MIDAVANADALPVLERLLQFAGQRHRLIVNNIANFDTPGYRPLDVSPREFQEQLRGALDQRRSSGRPQRSLDLKNTDRIEFSPGSMTLHPTPVGRNILFHDGNDRDLERTMQDLVENFLTFRIATELMRNRFDLLRSVIAERV